MRIEDSHASICRHTNPTATIAIRNQSLQPQGPPYPRLFFKTTSHCNTVLISKRCAHSRPVDGIPLQVFQPTLSAQNPNCEPHRDSSCQTQINNSRLGFSCMRFVLTKGHFGSLHTMPLSAFHQIRPAMAMMPCLLILALGNLSRRQSSMHCIVRFHGSKDWDPSPALDGTDDDD